MGRRMIKLTMVALLLAILSSTASAVTVLDPQYKAEVYATYDYPDGTVYRPEGMTSDSSGNLYVVHIGGSIYKITPDGFASEWITGLSQPEHAVWGGGSAYGDYLYVTELGGRITRIDANGDKGTFSEIYSPSPIAIDPTGAYGGKMYTGTRTGDHIASIYTNGNVQTFSAFPYDVAGGPESITFDSGSKYDGSMYVSTYAKGDTYLSGIFKMDTNGIVSRFAPDVVAATNIEIDPLGFFNGDMFATAMVNEFGEYWLMNRISDDGQATLFLDGNIYDFTFGQDGAMYVVGSNQTGFEITRITLIPEPVSLLLMSLGGVIVSMKRKRK